MTKVRRKGASATDYSPRGLIEWFSRLDLEYTTGDEYDEYDDNDIDRTRASILPPLSDLKPIRLAEMDTTKKYSGRYLLCRAKGAPFLRYGLAFPAEDQDGHLFIVYARNYPLYGVKQTDLDKLFFPGTGLLIREPAFTLSTTEGMPSDVRVSSPTDMEPGYDPYAAGQAYLDAEQPYLAVQAFTEAIARAETQQDTVRVTLKRAHANLKAGRPAAAYQDTSIVLMYLDMGVPVALGDRSVALTTRLNALSAAGLHDLAELVRDDLFSLHEDEVTRLDGIDEALGKFIRSGDDSHLKGTTVEGQIAAYKMYGRIEGARRRQQHAQECKKASESGDYNLFPFEQGPSPPLKPPCDRLKLRDYVGPIRVAQLKKRTGGRGVIATRDIKPGELLLVEKAFAVADFGTLHDLSIDAQADQIPHRPKHALAAEVAARVLDDPSTLSVLESLFDGRGSPERPLVFGALSKRSIPKYASAPISLDMDWVERICRFNGFNFPPSCLPELDSPNLGAPGWRTWSALFLNGSAFNHSCLPNTYHKTVGDLLVVRARVPVKKGKEVYVSYAPIDRTPSHEIWDVLDRHFGDNGCPCAYCVETKDDDNNVLEHRQNALDQFDEAFDDFFAPGESTPEACAEQYAHMSTIVADICSTYMGDCNVKPELVEPYAKLVEVASGDRRSTDTVLHGPMAVAWSNAVAAAGGACDLSGDVCEFDPAPLCWTETIVESTFEYAQACIEEGSPAASARALHLLTILANLSRVEHGDNLEHFWRRWRTNLSEFEEFKERLVEGMAEGDK
ncbi:hypothetical protein JCM3775_003529 [Rhodotorula graminis]